MQVLKIIKIAFLHTISILIAIFETYSKQLGIVSKSVSNKFCVFLLSVQ